VGTSFGEIFFGNAAAIGLPCLTADAADVERLMSHAEAGPALVTVDVAALRVRLDGARGERLDVAAQLPETARQAFLDGSWDATGELLRNYDDVLRTAARLPYLTDFRT
jgi:3-isopropylmalate/(R)-2-methylmalate dehydratase small subunit